MRRSRRNGTSGLGNRQTGQWQTRKCAAQTGLPGRRSFVVSGLELPLLHDVQMQFTKRLVIQQQRAPQRLGDRPHAADVDHMAKLTRIVGMHGHAGVACELDPLMQCMQRGFADKSLEQLVGRRKLPLHPVQSETVIPNDVAGDGLLNSQQQSGTVQCPTHRCTRRELCQRRNERRSGTVDLSWCQLFSRPQRCDSLWDLLTSVSHRHREEEFPFFRGFWVVRPKQDERCVTVLALLDSPSVAGAYKFELTPGMHESQLQVESVLHFRRSPDKVALAPLTSMWIWGDGLDGPPKDARPAVHDSDGLLVQHRKETVTPDDSGPPSSDGASSEETSEWTWRAFARQSYPSVSRIAVDQLIGFGLMQRNRSFYHYDDHNARYDLRPSVWVTTDLPWSDGVIELLELPGAHEGVDNIAAYWVPDCRPTVGEPIKLNYTVSFFAGDYGRQVNGANRVRRPAGRIDVPTGQRRAA